MHFRPSIESSNTRSEAGKSSFRDELIQVWFLYHLAVIGEALRAMSADFQAAHPAINWQGWTGLRNIVVHQYFRIHPERIWDTIDRNLPQLKEYLHALPGDEADPSGA